MRTKVEKRRVRQDPPSVALSAHAPEGDGNAVPARLSPSALSSSAGDRQEVQRDADRRPVSISEAERLAAANHVVVNLGPPVIVGPARLFDGKGDAAGGVMVGGDGGSGSSGGIIRAHSGGLSKPYDMSVLTANSVVMPEEKAIKKPPKKRRNDKRDVALDLSTTSALHGSLGTELHPPSSESTVIPPPVPAQLQQPPITPPTPSPQHHMTSSPQHSALHSSALLCRSPPNPTPLLQQTPPSSSEPVMMDTAGDPMEMTHSNDVSDLNVSSQEESSSVTRFVMSDSEALPVPESEVVLPSSENLHTEVPSLLQQPEAIQTMDVGESEISSATSTSLLQPPTWLLTPQENPPGREASEHESMAASDQRTAETSSAISPDLEASSGPQLSSSPKKPSKKVAKNTAAKSKSAKSKAKTEVGKGKQSDNCEESSKDGAVISESTNNPLTASVTNETEDSHIPVQNAGSISSEGTKSVSKSEKPQKKKPMVDDENSKERLAKIEDSINCVIARYVYDCEDVSKLDRLRQAAREADAKAESENTNNTNLGVVVKPSAAVKFNSASESGISVKESQDNACSSSEVVVPPQPAKPKKRPAAKKKKAEPHPTEDTVNGGETKPEEGGTVESKSPKKKAKKSKEKKTVSKTDGSGDMKDTSNTATSVAEAQSESVSVDKAKPSPPKKKASKKKAAPVTNSSESQPASDAVPNGHLESATGEAPKPAKKKKSKPKAKKDIQDGDKTLENSKMQNGSAVSEALEASTSTSQPEQGGEAATKPEVKSKPKKAKKRKSENTEKESSEKKDGEENKGEAGAEVKADSESSKPPPKKKKKKEVKEGETVEPKKKKSPSKSKKANQPKSASETPNKEETTPSENGLPVAQDVNENADTKPSESSENKSAEEAGTSTEEGKDSKVTTTVVKKVKKTLDEVVCPDCGHKTRGQAALSRHMKKMHEKSVVLPYPCPKQPECEYSASKVSLLARHMLTHRLYMCSRCQFTVDAKDKYEEHLQTEHNVKLDCKLCKKCNRYVKCDTVPMEKHLEDCQGPVPFTCEDCGKEFKYESSLKVHHHTHYPDQPKLFNCTQCEYASNYRANLHKHIQNMHVKRPRDIKCLQCDKMFSTEDNMRRHMKIHTQVRPFKCHKCEKAFKSQCALRGHLVSHEVARPYKCNIDNCQREFRTPKFLKSHQEEFHRLIPKKYHCHRCNFSFFKLSHLKRHEISHTGERNFHCDHPGCGKSFRHSDNLKVHLRQHTNERPISCPHCKFTCRQKSSLQWHLKKEHNQSLPVAGLESKSSDDVTVSLDDKSPEVITIPEGTKLPEGLKLPEGFRLPEGVKLPEGVDLAESVEVVELDNVNMIIPTTEGEELPVTILELRSMDMYEFHSDNDSSDEATPGVFKRDKTKMASSAPLPPPPKELLLKNAVFDVLDEEGKKAETEEGSSKPKKKKSSNKKAAKAKVSTPKEGEEGEKVEESQEKGSDEAKKKKAKKTPASKKTNSEPKKKASPPKSKKKAAAAAKQETAEAKDSVDAKDEQKEEETKEETAAPSEAAEVPVESKSPTKAKKSPAKKKTPTKTAAKEEEAVEQKEKPTKTKAPAKGKKSPKTRASPKKPTSPKGKPAKPATRKTPPRKAATAKKGGKTTTKKTPAKKTTAKKKTATKKKAPAKKKVSKKAKEVEEQPAELESNAKEENEEQETVPEPKPKEKPSPPNRIQTTRRSRETRNSLAAAEEASSPLRPSSPIESEEENMPQGAGSPYREFDSQDMDDSSSEPRDSPSLPPSPARVEEPSVPSPMAELEGSVKEGDEDAMPQNMETQEEAEASDAEDIMMNDIPLTPPRAPAPPPQESSDEEEMIPSPPTHMPMSADTSDTAAPSSVLTDQPGSQAPEFQQPHSREEFQQPHSHQDFQQPHSREEFQQPLSQQPQSVEYPHHHSREEVMQPHSREEYPQHHSREEYPQPHSREDYSQQQSREEYSQPHSREEYSQPHSREEYSQPHSREEYPQQHSREEYPQHHSREEYPQHHSREEYPQQHSREEYPQPRSREDYPQQHSREELQPQGSVPEPMSEPVHSVHSEGLPDDVAMPHPVTPYDPVAAQTIPTSEAESAYQYLQGLAQSGETITEPLAGEPSRLQQLEALAEKPHEDSRSVPNMVKSPVGAAPTSVITSMSPSAGSLAISASETSSRRMEILSTDRQVEQALIRDSPSALPRLPEGAYDAYSALNPLAASAARDNNNLFPAPPSTPSFMRLTESEAVLQRQRMTTPFLPSAQPPERSLSRLPESPLQPPNPSALLRRPATMADGMFPAAPGMPQTMPRNPFTNTWASQDVRPPHWGQAPTYLQRPSNAPTTPFPFATKDNYQFMFDPTVRPGVTERNMFASLSTTQSQRDLASEASPFQFDLSPYFGSHPYSGATGLDYSRTAVGATPKTLDERYRQTAASMSEFRPLPPTTSTDMFSGIGVGVNSLNSASFNLDKYAMYGRDPMYHAAAQQLTDNTNSAFLTHAAPTQHSMFDRDYPHRSLYSHQNPAYPLFNDRQYPAAAKLTGHPAPSAMSHERDFIARPTANENQMQDPYRCGMLYNMVNRYPFE